MTRTVLAIALAVFGPLAVRGGEPLPERGYELLVSKPYLPAEFDEELFDDLWKVWPQEMREKAATATKAERRKTAFSRYGFVERPGHDADDPTGPPLSYVQTKEGWATNCFLCHGGKVAGRVIPGLPNSHVAMKTLADDIRWTRLLSGKGLRPSDVGNMSFHLGGSDGTTNAVGFGVAFAAMRNADMSLKPYRPIDFDHHDMDAPPWWHAKKKEMLYLDGHAPKTHRPLMTFTLAPDTSPRDLTDWEEDFRHVLAYIESLEPPAYPWEIDETRAARGRVLFEANCAKCHGTYGEVETYPEMMVPLDDVGTDPVRLTSLTPKHRSWLKEGWMSRYGKDPVVLDPKGYVAPPLDGIWATAPYLHNGSVPTLWHLLNPDDRPKVWKRTEDGYDQDRVGLEIETFDSLPLTSSPRDYFDTTKHGKSAGGHDYPDVLDENEKRDVLEYLKSL